jgi:hypothetical protein
VSRLEGHAANIENAGNQARVTDPMFEQGVMGDFMRSAETWLYRTK